METSTERHQHAQGEAPPPQAEEGHDDDAEMDSPPPRVEQSSPSQRLWMEIAHYDSRSPPPCLTSDLVGAFEADQHFLVFNSPLFAAVAPAPIDCAGLMGQLARLLDEINARREDPQHLAMLAHYMACVDDLKARTQRKPDDDTLWPHVLEPGQHARVPAAGGK
jgi:hypothetical protein